MRAGLVVCFLLHCVGAIAQTGWRTFPKKSRPDSGVMAGGEGVLSDTLKIISGSIVSPTPSGTLHINVSPEIMALDSQLTETYRNNPSIDGYTIQIFSLSGANSRARAYEARVKFEEAFPDIRSYVTWRSPNYVVRVGDFRTKLEAEKVLRQIKETYPAALVKRAKVALPELEESEDK